MKLKTLKDLSIMKDIEDGDEPIQRKELKEEAIKWVQVCRCRRYEKDKFESGCAGCVRFIHFFNITPEDLK